MAEAFGEMGDEVSSNTFPGGIRNGDWDKFAQGRFGKRFGSGTEVASSYVIGDELVHVGPPVIVLNEVLGVPAARMASNGGVMLKP